ncbi:TonB system transport protein ExbD [Isoptericola jiangsuensis]|uniref:TonB system transport protein ExbD n=1 Tax=Isoptericola jiangsuensis TaxID=548579 RepID=UPI0038704769
MMAPGPRDDDADLQESHEINVTPFIDVMLVLLIIFMVAAPLATVQLSVELPSSTATATPPESPPIQLQALADGRLELDGTAVPRAELAAALDAISKGDREQRVFVSGDRRIAYGDLMAVLDALRDAGYLKVALVGQPADPA